MLNAILILEECMYKQENRFLDTATWEWAVGFYSKT